MIKNNKKYVPVLVVDFGSQTTQLILRRIREIGIYCEVISYYLIMDKIKELKTLRAFTMADLRPRESTVYAIRNIT